MSLEVPSAYIHPNPHLTIQEIYTVMKNSWEMKSDRKREVIMLIQSFNSRNKIIFLFDQSNVVEKLHLKM